MRKNLFKVVLIFFAIMVATSSFLFAGCGDEETTTGNPR